jgi:hypothetical protein
MNAGDLPEYSRIRVKDLKIRGVFSEEVNFYYLEGDKAYCQNDKGHETYLELDTPVEYLCTMKEYINNLNQ